MIESEKFEEFKQKQIAILEEKEAEKYKDDSWKDNDPDDLFENLLCQLDELEFSEDKEHKQRRLLHIANYAFFLHEKLEGE